MLGGWKRKLENYNEPSHEKTNNLHMQTNKDADQLCSNCTADHAFVFATRIVQFLLKFQASCILLWLYSLVCVGPGRKPKLLVL